MQVKDIMTHDPVCCTKDTSLRDAARLMDENDCGALPVVASNSDRRLIGVITDRDIVVRTLADGKDPFQMAVGDCMSPSEWTVSESDRIEDCSQLMKEHQVRRVFVTDGGHRCIGVVAQADLATSAPEHETGEVVKEVSQPAHAGV